MHYFTSFKNLISNHKKTSIAIVVLLVGGIIWYVSSNGTTAITTYTLGTVTKGTVVSTVTGTGQVSSVNQITIPTKSSGEITSVRVMAGDRVTAGQIIATIDNQSARISLTQAENTLAKAKQNLTNDSASYDLSSKNQQITLNSSLVAQPSIDNENSNSPTLSGSYNSTERGVYTVTTYPCSKGICMQYSGIESGSTLIALNIPLQLGTRGVYITFTTTPKVGDVWTIAVPSPLANSYLSQTQNIETSAQSHEITIANDQNAIRDAETSLASAQLTYDNTFVRAPIDGIIGQVPLTKGQTVSSGSTAAILVGTQQFADIAFNEVDVAKIHLGDRATATFDAISDLMVTGHVTSIDQIGTVTSGVVNYTVRIVFDTNDTRVKSSMSTSVVITTASHTDVLMVPNSAIKTSNGSSYVLIAANETDPNPSQQPIETGLIDDTNTEVVSGLTEGNSIVLKTVTATATKTTSAAPSILGAVGGRAGGR